MFQPVNRQIHLHLTVLAGPLLHGLILLAPFLPAFFRLDAAPLPGQNTLSLPAGPVLIGLAVLLASLEGACARQSGDASGLAVPTAPADRLLQPLSGLSLLVLTWISLLHPGFPDLSLSLALVPALACLIAGSLLLLAGGLLRCHTIRVLGAGFVSSSRVPGTVPLVTSGPYRRVRHPSESGLLLMIAGIPLLMASPAGLLFALLVCLPLCLIRVLREDRELEQSFGESFTRYRQRSGLLWPAWG